MFHDIIISTWHRSSRPFHPTFSLTRIRLLSALVYSLIMSMNQRRQEKDYTAEVKALQTEAEQIAKVSLSDRDAV